MPTEEPRRSEIATRYGGVLFTLARQSPAFEEILEDVTRLQHCLVAEPLEWRRVTSPTTPLRIQSQVVEKLATSLKLGHLVSRFLKLVCHNHRLQNLGSMLEDFVARQKVAAGLVEGVVETATALSPKTMDTLQAALAQHLGKKVTLHQVIRESLLGGVVLRIGSLMIDTSIGAQLNKLRHVMKG